GHAPLEVVADAVADSADSERTVHDHADEPGDETVTIRGPAGEKLHVTDAVLQLPAGVEPESPGTGLAVVKHRPVVVAVGHATELAQQDLPDQVVVLAGRAEAVAQLHEEGPAADGHGLARGDELIPSAGRLLDAGGVEHRLEIGRAHV